jgi:hypothetical protein
LPVAPQQHRKTNRPGHRDRADALLDARLKATFTADANDTLYQWASSGDYDPSPNLEKIEAAVLAINCAGGERNPAETGSWTVRSSGCAMAATTSFPRATRPRGME